MVAHHTMLSDTLLIAGCSRSGSTLLGMLLSRQEGVFFAGESIRWPQQWTNGMRCGCQKPFRECDFWSTVLQNAGVDMTRISPGDPTFIETVVQVHESVRQVTGARAIVDSSKHPDHIAQLAGHPRVKATTLHIVRDPRGHVLSAHRGWKNKQDPDLRPPLLKTAKVVESWKRVNRACGRLITALGPSALTLRYEDLVANPDRHLEAIAEVAGLGVGRRSDIGVEHIPAGNPVRFTRDDLAVFRDDAWERVLPAWQQWFILVMGLPLTATHHYIARHT
jgi:Sulfotransferase family